MNPQLHSRFFALFFFCLCLSTLSLEAQQDEEVIIYVDESKASNVHLLRMDSYGKNWSTAFRNLHDALRFGDPKATQIWMAKGNYYVDQGATFDDQKNDSPTTDYLNPFLVSNRNLTIYGGFAGTETSLEDRDLTNADNATYLDGNVYYKSTDDLPSNTDFGKWTQRFAERILVVHNSTLTLDGLVFQYVRAADHSSNSGAGDGGFIAANQSALKINNCLFQYGILGYDGQILYVRNNTEPLEIRNSRLAKCGRAESFIYLSSVDKVTLNNSVIEELKTGTDQSKVIYLFNTTADLEFKNNVLANNEYLQIRVGAVNRGAIDIDIENLLAFNNTLEDDKNDDGFLVVLSDYDTTKSNVNVSIANASFINNTGSNSMIYFEDDNINWGE